MATGSIDEIPSDERRLRLSGIQAIISSDPVRAIELADDYLAEVPDDPPATLLLGIAHRFAGRYENAILTLQDLVRATPESSLAHLQLGLALREAGDLAAAIRALKNASESAAPHVDAWLTLADALFESGDRSGADSAYLSYTKQPVQDTRLEKATAGLVEGALADAESYVKDRLQFFPTDIIALCLLADICERQGRTGEAELCLERCLMLAPGYRRARHNYAVVMLRQNRLSAALRHCQQVLNEEPTSVDTRKLLSAIRVQMRDYDESIRICNELLSEFPDQATVWTSLGHMLKSAGHREECISAYRKAISLAPENGEPYWALANLKTFHMPDADLASMTKALERLDLCVADRVHLQFAVARSLEQREDFETAFSNYAAANRLHRQHHPYDPGEMAGHVACSRTTFTKAFFEYRSSWGVAARDPIFVLGLPRAGSTLVEQILASHSRVEGTMELPNIAAIAHSVARQVIDKESHGYHGNIERLDKDNMSRLGKAYLEQTRIQRKSVKPFFVDKMPNNFAHIGLIHTLLPNARIIDVRRHPMACGLSLYKEHFAKAQLFSYDLTDIGRYYTHYVELMEHYDEVLPGTVHRVIYEDLVDAPETEIRKMLDFCELKFEQSCLEFHHNKRAVSTASAEQVRTPINRDGLNLWQHFEPWLDDLRREVAALDNDYRAGATN